MSRQARALDVLMTDECPSVRQAAVTAVAAILNTYWELIPAATAAAFISKLIDDIAHDVNSVGMGSKLVEGTQHSSQAERSSSEDTVPPPPFYRLYHYRRRSHSCSRRAGSARGEPAGAAGTQGCAAKSGVLAGRHRAQGTDCDVRSAAENPRHPRHPLLRGAPYHAPPLALSQKNDDNGCGVTRL